MSEGIMAQVTFQLGPKKIIDNLRDENAEKDKTSRINSITKAWKQKSMNCAQGSVDDSV